MGGAISQTGLPQNSISTSPSPITMTPCYILKRTFTKVNLLSYPNNLRGGAFSQTGLPQNSISTSPSPITMTPCYILKRTFTKVNLLNYPNNLGGCYLANRITTKLHLHFPLPNYNDTVLYSKTNFYKSQPPQLPQQFGGGGCYLANRITTKLHLHFPFPHYNDTVLYSKTNFYNLGGCYLANRITTKLHLHFPLPHYNDTVLYSKTNFYKSQPQLPQQLGGAISQTGSPQNSISTSPSPITMTPCYILKRSLTKVNPTLGGYLKKQGHHKTSPLLTMTSCYILKQISTKANHLDSPITWGGGLSHKPDYHKTLTSTFPLTIMWCYISKRSFTNVNLLNSPNSWEVVISPWTGLPQNSTSPPYNDVMLHSKANFNKSQPPQFPQQKSQNMGSLGDNCSPPNFWPETQKTKPTKQNKQTKTQGLLVTSWSCFPPYLLPRPLPPPLPQTVIP